MRVTFTLVDRPEIAVDIAAGESVMRAAVDNGVPGIYGDCGGQCACATCHIYIHEEWIDRVGRAPEGSVEGAMLEGAPADVQANSRLACQVICEPSLDGLIMLVPEGQ